MPHLDWSTLNRLSAFDLTGGLSTVAPGLGELAGKKSRAMLASLIAQSKQAVEVKRRLERDLAKLDTALATVENVYSQAMDLASRAQELASESTSSTPLSMLDRLNTAISSLETVVSNAQVAYEQAGALPNVPAELQGSPDDPANVQQWLDAAIRFDKAAAALKQAQQQATRLGAQLQGAYKQIQAVVTREQQQAAAVAAREAAQQAAVEARERQRQMLEDQRLQQELAIERARMQAELQQQQALIAPPVAAPLPPAPAGYTYYDPTTGQYAGGAAAPPQGPTYAAATYAEGAWAAPQSQGMQVPQGYSYTAPGGGIGLPQGYSYTGGNAFGFGLPQSQGMQVPQPAPQALQPGWTTLEYEALMEGESQYLRGLGALGAEGTFAKSINRALGLSAPTTSTGRTGVVRFDSSNTTITKKPGVSEDLSNILGAVGDAFKQVGPMFGLGPRQPEPEPQRETPWGTVALIGGIGILGVVGAAAVSRALNKPTPRRSYRRRGRR